VNRQDGQEFFVWTLFQQLRRRDFALGPNEYGLLRRALQDGFGWSSRKELREVCAALWAKSHEEREVVAALFDQHMVADWALGPAPLTPPSGSAAGATRTLRESQLATSEGIEAVSMMAQLPDAETAVAPATASTGRLPPLALGEVPALPFAHVFLPQYPVNFRSVAQAWRRLRWPVREGPATELDVEATIRQRSRAGVVSPPVLRPRRRNRARLLLLVDRQGSMAPFHAYVDQVCQAISQAGRLRQVAVFYFHDVPLEGADPAIFKRLSGGPFSSLDSILTEIPQLTAGELYTDKELMTPVPARSVFSEHAQDAAVVIISDAGAARGKYDLLRLLDTVAFLNGLKDFAYRAVWLNPLPAATWAPSSAAQIARHLPMFAMDHDGMHRAVNVLRGQPYAVEKPLSASSHVAHRLPPLEAGVAAT
jgi:uncharacterized protein with von Willebrand factor type A (vWA) domain